MSLFLLSALNKNRLWKTMFFYFSMHELCTITDYHTVVECISTNRYPSTLHGAMSSQPSTVFRKALEALILVFHKVLRHVLTASTVFRNALEALILVFHKLLFVYNSSLSIVCALLASGRSQHCGRLVCLASRSFRLSTRSSSRCVHSSCFRAYSAARCFSV